MFRYTVNGYYSGIIGVNMRSQKSSCMRNNVAQRVTKRCAGEFNVSLNPQHMYRQSLSNKCTYLYTIRNGVDVVCTTRRLV